MDSRFSVFKASLLFKIPMRHLCKSVMIAIAFHASLSTAESTILEPELAISVVPRIGLFDKFLFFRDGPSAIAPSRAKADKTIQDFVTDSWKPFAYKDYWDNVHPTLRETFPHDTRFELLTGTAPNIGYGYRWVTVGIRNLPAGRVSDCHLTVNVAEGNRQEYSSESECEWTVKIDNAATPLILRYKIDGVPAEKALTGTVPEDFLIVSLGDSYASGEGNPDGLTGNPTADGEPKLEVPQGGCKARLGSGVEELARLTFNDKDDKNCAPLWMDQRCHRSAWAGPIQAGLKLINSPERQWRSRMGAFTIISLACSGATIDKGLRGEYRDTPGTFLDLEKGFSRRGIVAADTKLNETDRNSLPTPPQLTETLKQTFAHDHGNKKSIDVMIISVGGNDVGFASVVSDMFDGNLQHNDLDALRKRKKADLETLEYENFPRLSGDLQGLDIRQVILTEYPDPTRRSALADADEACSQDKSASSEFCSGAPAAGFIFRKIAEVMGKELSAEESRFTYCGFVLPLGKVLDRTATQFGWYFAGGVSDSFVGKGWCADSQSEPYRPQQRWFRRADESIAYQGSVHGAVHPTWEGHREVYAKRIYEAVATSFKRELHIDIQSASAKRGGITYVKAPLLVALREGEEDRTTKDRICLTSSEDISACTACLHPSDRTTTHCSVNGRFNAGTLALSSVLRAKHADTARIFQKPLRELLVPATNELRLDGTGPSQQLNYLPRPRGLCQHRWLSGACDLEIVATDDGVGVRDLQVEFRNCQNLESPWEECISRPKDARIVAADSESALVALKMSAAEFEPSRYVKMRTTATDRLDNSTIQMESFGIDAEVPSITGVKVHGASLLPLKANVAIPITDQTIFTVTLSDSVSQLQSFSIASTGSKSTIEFYLPDATETLAEFKPWIFSDGIVPVDVNMRAQDKAGNVGVVGEFRAIPIRLKYGQVSHSAADWGRIASSPERQKVIDRVKLMSGNFGEWLAMDDTRWPILSAWLNLASGLVFPDRLIKHAMTSNCTANEESLSATLYAVLLLADSCLQRFPERAAELGGLFGTALQNQETWSID